MTAVGGFFAGAGTFGTSARGNYFNRIDAYMDKENGN